MLANLTDEQWESLPAELQEAITDFYELEEARLEQLHEIEIMQARLSERYRDTHFALPKLDTAVQVQ